MFSVPSASVHQFSMVARPDVPRSRFDIQKGYKTAFDAGYLVPVYVDEVLPGDTFRLEMTAFARLATPIFPLMDNLYLESFFFFVPNRLLWANWVKFMGEQLSPNDSTSYLVPQIVSPVNGWTIGSTQDYMGLPTVGQVASGAQVSSNVLPLRAYNQIYNEWFRDENLVPAAAKQLGDGPDLHYFYPLRRRGKRHDYFTSALPWPQKGNTVSMPLGTTAPVFGDGKALGLTDGSGNFGLGFVSGVGPSFRDTAYGAAVGTALGGTAPSVTEAFGVVSSGNSGLYADLSAATAATINQLRQSFQIQRLLERDARGGTRYTEIIRAHFGVVSPDARLQRPEYLGGGRTAIAISPIAQTSGTGASGTTSPVGTLGAMATALARSHGFSQSFTEHGYIIGLVNVRADLTYQQGMRRLWNRQTRYDFYFPAFAHLGEQAILNKEIYCRGDAFDDSVFGYQERWAEYRYNPSEITGLFRSTAAGTIDAWHLAQRFSVLPTLNETFIHDTPPLDRVLAVGAAANGKQILFDALFKVRAVRPLPMYSVPGLIDHF